MTNTLPAIRKRLSVPLSPLLAFDVLTRRLPDWWPVASHSLSGNEGKLPREIRVDGRAGGFVSEIRHDGQVANWGTITIWEPGLRFGINWHVGRAPSQATYWQITFSPAVAGTDVELVHTGFERLGPAAEAAAANYDEGWDLVFGECYRRACAD